MSQYIHFTSDQKHAAKHADLAAFLTSRGEELTRSGSEYMWRGHISIRGNKFYDHYEQVGDTAVEFVQKYFNADYQTAVQELLGVKASPTPTYHLPRQSFTLPPKHSNMRRVFAYLIQQRGISPSLLTAFANRGLLYEDSQHHNAVFVGVDKTGKPRHAHKKSTANIPGSFRANQTGSEAAFSFRWCGTSDKLYVFEAPIDMLSFITLHPENWRADNYVALCSVADHALVQMLADYPSLRKVALCLDNDTAGQTATKLISDRLTTKGYETTTIVPQHKDFNEDLQEAAKCQTLQF